MNTSKLSPAQTSAIAHLIERGAAGASLYTRTAANLIARGIAELTDATTSDNHVRLTAEYLASVEVAASGQDRMPIGPRGRVNVLEPDRAGNGTSRTWRRTINGTVYSFNVVNMPNGELRLFVRHFNGYCGGMAFACAWTLDKSIFIRPAVTIHAIAAELGIAPHQVLEFDATLPAGTESVSAADAAAIIEAYRAAEAAADESATCAHCDAPAVAVQLDAEAIEHGNALHPTDERKPMPLCARHARPVTRADLTADDRAVYDAARKRMEAWNAQAVAWFARHAEHGHAMADMYRWAVDSWGVQRECDHAKALEMNHHRLWRIADDYVRDCARDNIRSSGSISDCDARREAAHAEALRLNQLCDWRERHGYISDRGPVGAQEFGTSALDAERVMVDHAEALMIFSVVCMYCGQRFASVSQSAGHLHMRPEWNAEQAQRDHAEALDVEHDMPNERIDSVDADGVARITYLTTYGRRESADRPGWCIAIRSFRRDERGGPNVAEFDRLDEAREAFAAMRAAADAELADAMGTLGIADAFDAALIERCEREGHGHCHIRVAGELAAEIWLCYLDSFHGLRVDVLTADGHVTGTVRTVFFGAGHTPTGFVVTMDDELDAYPTRVPFDRVAPLGEPGRPDLAAGDAVMAEALVVNARHIPAAVMALAAS